VLEELRAEMRRLADPAKAAGSAWFFKTGKGQYGEGDVFLGLTVPQQRALVRRYSGLAFDEIRCLLESRFHEERLVALLILVRRFQRATAPAERKRIYAFFMRHRHRANNWDLVDSSAPYIAGGYLYHTGGAAVLDRLARSRNLWERRIAMVSTLYFICRGDPAPALRIAEALVDDREDLIHKAAGWMLREAGKRCGEAVLESFLDRHAPRMPRTMLRYAVERLPDAKRRRYMAIEKVRRA
jgi:3-methyladenine DNA glycosylase AlkD